MDQTQLIVELARQIEAQQASHQIWFWLLLIAVSGVAGAIGAFGSSYFRKRGDTKAIQADLERLSSQQATIAAAVGRVETEISHADWRKRELITLRREKLERLLEAAVDCAEWETLYTRHLWFGSAAPDRPNPVSKMESLCELYFRELSHDVGNLALAQRRMVADTTSEQRRRLEAAAGGIVPLVGADAMARNTASYDELLAEIAVLRGKIPAVMNTILGEEFGDAQDYTSLRKKPKNAAAAGAPATAEERPERK